MIRVNGNEYLASTVFATDGSMSMTFETNDTLEAIEGNFPVECVIEVTEKGETVAKYYNKQVLSLKVENGFNRKVTVVFAVSEIQRSAEDKLSERADTSDDAIAELAALTAEQMERTDSADDAIGKLKANVSALAERVKMLEDMARKTITTNTTEVSNG